jgi:hypothetical protein
MTLYWIAIFFLACFAAVIELAARAEELPWHE